MQQIIDGLTEIQKQLEAIESRLATIENNDIVSLEQAELLLKTYHQHVIKLENMILSRRIELLEKKFL